MTATAPHASPQGRRSPGWLAIPIAALALVSLTVGLVAREHLDPGGDYFELFFSDTLHLKAWLATAAVVLAVTQLVTAAWIFRKLPWRRPSWVPAVHRWTGRLALLVTLPVAYHCVFRLGFQDPDARVLAHSLAGCVVYGAFAAKVLVVRLHRFPVWVLPAAGGLLFATLVAAWYSSALWLFRLAGVEL